MRNVYQSQAGGDFREKEGSTVDCMDGGLSKKKKKKQVWVGDNEYV